MNIQSDVNIARKDLLPLVGGTSLVLLWWLYANYNSALPSPIRVGNLFLEKLTVPGPYGHYAIYHLGITLSRVFMSVFLMLLIGSVIGFGLARVNFFKNTRVIILFWMQIPSLLTVFIFLLWFGFNNLAVIAIVFVNFAPFVAINIEEGIRSVDNDLLEMGDIFRASRYQKIRHIFIPALMPYFFASLRWSLSTGWKVMVIAEAFGLEDGLGAMLILFYDRAQIDQVFAWLLFMTIFMLLLERFVIQKVGGKVFAWRGGVVNF